MLHWRFSIHFLFSKNNDIYVMEIQILYTGLDNIFNMPRKQNWFKYLIPNVSKVVNIPTNLHIQDSMLF